MFWSGVHGVIVLGLLTTGSFYLTVTQLTLVQAVNVFLGISVYWILYLLFGRAERAIGWGNLFIGLTGTVNYYLMRFRGAPFQLSDIKAAETAGNVIQGYDFTPGFLLLAGVLDLLLWYLVFRQYLQCRRWGDFFEKKREKAVGGPGSVRMRIGGSRSAPISL